jgi:hypothetical protein
MFLVANYIIYICVVENLIILVCRLCGFISIFVGTLFLCGCDKNLLMGDFVQNKQDVNDGDYALDSVENQIVFDAFV